jgi:salicylate hydroxylase
LRDPAVADNAQLLGKTLAERFDWLWDHDLQSDLQEAREQLGWKVPA